LIPLPDADRPMPPRPEPREPQRDDRSQAPARHKAAPWGPEHNRTPPFPPPHYRIADGRLKDASGAADAAGPCPVPDPAARSPKMAATGNRPLPGQASEAQAPSLACPDTDRKPERKAQNPP